VVKEELFERCPICRRHLARQPAKSGDGWSFFTLSMRALIG